MNILHLTASTFHGGPERQMLGLAHSLPNTDESVFLSFAEGGRCRHFLSTARHHGFEAVGLANDTPHLWAAVREVAGYLEHFRADLLCCHGYKANIVGRLAARRQRIPVIAVARGWTGENFKVRMYERLDRLHLRWMDHVVCVSAAQAAKVHRAGVRADRVSVICNAIDPARFHEPDGRYRAKLLRYFRKPRTHVVGAAGRLSPEKGFEVLVAAAERVLREHPGAGFILFGEGAERERLQRQIQAAGMTGTFVLGGFRPDLDRFLPHFDLLTLPSYTEGLPNVVLEAFAAGVPVVATAVGGTPEVVQDKVSGYLVPPGDAGSLAEHISLALQSANLAEMGRRGRLRVHERFGFAAQARQYRDLFINLRPHADTAPEGTSDNDVVTPSTNRPAPAGSKEEELIATGSPCHH
jgi:glycosyltransferase involved in cell wall biosynthesis